jgi:hypothetical protein
MLTTIQYLLLRRNLSFNLVWASLEIILFVSGLYKYKQNYEKLVMLRGVTWKRGKVKEGSKKVNIVDVIPIQAWM